MYKCRNCYQPLKGQDCFTCRGKGFIEGIGGREIKCETCFGQGETDALGTRLKINPLAKAKWHFYGGWVCSIECDRGATLSMRGSFPGAGPCRRLSPKEEEDLRIRWSVSDGYYR